MPGTRLNAAAHFRGGPLDGQTTPMRAAGRSCEYRDEVGLRIRLERGTRRAVTVGGLYILTGQRPPTDAPVGSRVYKWIPPKPTTPQETP